MTVIDEVTRYDPTDDVRRQNQRIYDWLAAVGGPDGYEDEEQGDRIISGLLGSFVYDMGGGSVLDYGCGDGRLLKLLKRAEVNADYLGVDIYPPALERARAAHPTGRFEDPAVLAALNGRFDFVVCAGPLSIQVAPDQERYFSDTLASLWSITGKRLYFYYNYPGQAHNNRIGMIYQYDPNFIAETCAGIVGESGAYYTSHSVYGTIKYGRLVRNY